MILNGEHSRPVPLSWRDPARFSRPRRV